MMPGATVERSSTRRFRYRAVDARGRSVRGAVVAIDRDSALAELARIGVHPVECVASTSGDTSGGERLGAADVAIGLRILATLVESGLPLRRIARTFPDLAPAAWRRTAAGLADALDRGESLSVALTHARAGISPEIIALVRGSESIGRAAHGLRAAADLAEARARAISALRASLAYPAILFATGIASTVLLVGVVLPRFAAMLADAGGQLPESTRLVLTLAEPVRAHWVLMTFSAVLCAVLAVAWRSTPRGRLSTDRLLNRAPVIGPIRQAAAAHRLASVLSALLTGGITLPTALRHAESAAGDAEVAGALASARIAVTEGSSLSAALAPHASVSPGLVRLVRAGEEAGTVPALLAYAADLEAQVASSRLQTALRLIEPILILAFALGIGVLSAALLQAVYSVHPA